LTATQIGTDLFLLEGGFAASAKYIVKGTPVSTSTVSGPTLEYIPPIDSDTNLVDLLAALNPPRTIESGWVIRLTPNPVANDTGFLVEISQVV
jgi:hypothetical protein